MAGDADDTTTPDSSAYCTERPRKEEPAPDGGDPGGSVSNASASPPATSAAAAPNKRPSSSIGKLITGGAMENNGGGVGASKVKKKATEFFPNKAHVTDALRSILANLDASHLTLVYEKHMEASDRSKGQHRLLMSCKCESKRTSFDSIFTETEMPLVQYRPEPLKTQEDEEEHGSKDKGKKKDGGGEDNNNKGCCNNDNNGKHKTNGGEEDADKDGDEQGKQKSTFQGLAVQAYDCDGRMYELNLKYLSCNTGYRITGSEWTVFLENNGLLVAGGGGVKTRKPSGRRRQKKRRSSLPSEGEESPNDEPQIAVRDAGGNIQMELWAFRSPKLSIGEKDQPEGALGLLLLHYRGGEAGTGEVQVAAGAVPRDQEAVVDDVEQPKQNTHGGMATQVAAGDCGGDAATAVDDDAAGKLGDAAPRSKRDIPLGPVERLAAVWLSFHDHSDAADVNDNGEADATDDCRCKQGPK